MMRIMIGFAACLLLLFAGMGIMLKLDEAPLAPKAQTSPVSGDKGPPALELPAGEGEQEADAVLQQGAHFAAGSKRDFGTINGISLTDGKADVMQKLGLPEAAPADEQLPSKTNWIYANIIIGFEGDQLDYIMVPKEAGHVNIGGQTLPVDIAAWKKAFGKPDFEAEDGFGYLDANGMAAKLFVDGSGSELTSIDFFWPMASE